jgi:hypothetical protein
MAAVRAAADAAAAVRAVAAAEGTTFFGVTHEEATAMQEKEAAVNAANASTAAGGTAAAPGATAGSGARYADDDDPWIGVCLTGALRAMAAQSVQTAFMAAMQELGQGGGRDGMLECMTATAVHLRVVEK